MDHTPDRVSAAGARSAASADSTRNDSTGPSDLDRDEQRRARALREEIAHTRDVMSDTIDAIQEKLNPRKIVAGATARAKQMTGERLKNMALIETARQNPIPAALFGFGTAWLLMSRSHGERDWEARPRYESAEYQTRGYGSGVQSWSSADVDERPGFLQRIANHPIPAAIAGIGLAWLAFARQRNGEVQFDENGRMSEAVGRVADRAQEYARTAASSASDAAGRAQEYASAVADRAQEYARDAGAAVSRTGRRAQTQLDRMINENPLLVSAGAMLLGIALGLVLPETEQEDEWLGDARDSMLDRAQDVARQAAANIQRAAGDVAGDVVSRVVSGNPG